VLVAFVIFYNLNFSTQILWIALLVVLAGLGFTAVGTVFAAMVSSIRTREVLLPILLFPIMVPIILAAVNGTQEVLILEEIRFLNRWIQLLVAFDVIFVATGFLLFDYVIAD
ncbi:heme exporter protein CcmB, partial [Acidobacteria bacterium AH-259-D05]|nr:heme exporter protein CcmB [Acidobacteria bacterium AH-259-D05]